MNDAKLELLEIGTVDKVEVIDFEVTFLFVNADEIIVVKSFADVDLIVVSFVEFVVG